MQLLLYAKADWRQGASWGPRWLTDLLPILVWMLAPVVNALRRVGRVVFVLACSMAIAIQAAGAFWYTGASNAKILAPTAGSNQMGAAWDFGNTPFIVELRHRRAPAELGTGVRGNLDTISMSDGATGKEIDVEGWALADGHSPREVIVLLDGQSVASTASFFARPDVSRTIGSTSPSGWSVTIPAHDSSPGEHVLSALVRAYTGGDLRFLAEKRFTNTTPPTSETQKVAIGKIALSADSSERGGLALDARMAIAAVTRGQQAPGYWLTSYTRKARFENPRVEMNTFLTSVMIDMLNPVATQAGLGETLQRARHSLTGQIEGGGLVRYHGRPDAPTIGTLGCAITPDADDTALVWRIAPAAGRALLPMALATLDRYRTPEGLYRTWLAPRDRYQCINPGKDPNPADVGIQMHVLMLFSQEDPAAARSLCRALEKTIDEDRIWVYYRTAPLIPILRQADMRRAGCSLRLPPSRLQTAVPGQEDWIAAGQLLQRILGAGGPAPASAEILNLLRKLSKDDFSSLRRSPPLLYHNDLTASVRRFYWSEEFGYALWLRLYFENVRHNSVRPAMERQRIQHASGATRVPNKQN